MTLILPRRSISLDFVRDGQASGDNYPDQRSKLDSLLTFTRASTATRFNSAGVLVTETNDQPRFDFDPATLACKGLLIEEQRTNLLVRSEELDNASWSVHPHATVSANAAVDPTGASTADKLVEDATNNPHQLGQVVALSAQPYTKTIFAKSAGRTVLQIFEGGSFDPTSYANFDLTAGIAYNHGYTSVDMVNCGNGWWRCSVTVTPIATTEATYFCVANSTAMARAAAYAGDGASGVLLWGAQLEAGALATSYISTASAAVTRAADSCSITQLAPWFNSSEGTWLIEGVGLPVVGPLGFFLSSETSEFDIAYNTSGGADGYLRTAAGVYSATFTDNSITFGAVARKVAMSYKQNLFAFSYAGNAPLTDSAGDVPGTPTTIRLGSANASYWINSHLRRVSYLPYKVSNSLLQALST
jgi:hypothetical protein